MYWLRRPPYLRWFAAGLLLAIGGLIEIRPTPTQSYPFTTTQIAAGQQVADAYELREIPAGILPAWDGDVRGLAAFTIPEGEPLAPWSITQVSIPVDWWAIPVPIPGQAAPGSAIRVAIADGTILEGVVIETGIEDGFQTVGMVAFAAPDAPQVAQAAANDALIVMIGTTSRVKSPTG